MEDEGNTLQQTFLLYFRRVVSPGLIRDVAETLIGRVFVIGIGLATSVIVARALGPEGRGLYAVAVSVGALGVQFGNLGLHASNTYYVSGNRDYLRPLTGNSLLVSFVVGGTGSFLVWLFFFIRPELAPVSGILLVLALGSVPIGLGNLLMQNLLIATNEIRLYNMIEVGTRALALLLIGSLFLVHSTKVERFFFMDLIGIFVGFGCALFFLKKQFDQLPTPSIPLLLDNLKYGLKAYVAAFFAFMVLKVDLLLVKYLLGAKDAGFYSIATAMADLIYLVPVVVGTMLFPRLSSMTERNEKWVYTKKVLWGMAVFSVFIALISVPLAQPAVKFLYGSQYLPSVPAFLWLLPGVCFLAVNTIFMNYFASIGFPLIAVVSPGLAMILNILLNLNWIPSHGIIGASMASAVSYGLMLLTSIVYVARSRR